jgi:tetratricopeptide (TPR) repeat protein
MTEPDHTAIEAEHFVARQAELARLNGFLDRSLSGKGQICFVSGETGIGKSALVAEFERQAQAKHADLVMAVGICDPQVNGGLPYAPFRDVLEMLTHSTTSRAVKERTAKENNNRLARTTKVFMDLIVKFGPDIINLFVPGVGLPIKISQFALGETGLADKFKQHAKPKAKEPGPKLPGPDQFNQDQVIEQYVNVIRALAEKVPLLLVLEDLHWADSASLNMLFRLSRCIENRRILIVGTYRPHEKQFSRDDNLAQLEQVLDEIKRYHGDVFVDLNRARSENGRAFIDAFLESEPNRLDETFRRNLFLHTGGQPLFTVELLRDLQNRGLLVKDVAGRWVGGNDLRWDRMPARVEGVIASRLAHLPKEMHETLKVASVEGEQFTAEVVAGVQTSDARSLIRQLSGDLQSAYQLVEGLEVKRISQQRLSRYRFSHQLFQHYLYSSLDPVELSYMHESIGLILETLYGEQAAEIAAQLARHFELAELPDKARLYLRIAGEQAAASYANDAALDFLNRALALTPANATQDRFALLANRERIYDLLGKRALQREDLNALTRLAEAMPGDVLKRAEVGLRRAKLAQSVSDYETAIAEAQAAIGLLEADKVDATPLLVDGYLIVARCLSVRGDVAESRQQLEQALEISRRQHYQPGEYRALTFMGTLQLGAGNYPAANDNLEQALRLARANGDARHEEITLSDLGVVATYQKKFSAAIEHYQQAQQIAQQIGDREREAVVITNLGWVSLESGDFPQVKRYSAQAAQLADELNDRKIQGVALINLCEAHWQLGEYVQANARGAQALELFRAIHFRWNEAIILADLGQIALSAGNCEQARQHAEESLAIARTIDSRPAQGTALILVGRALAGLGRLEEAEAAFNEAVNICRGLDDTAGVGAAQVGLASVALAHGELESPGLALAQIEEVLVALLHEPPEALAGMLPLWAYAVCLQVLQVGHDPRGAQLMAVATAKLQARAARISDPAARQSFLLNVPENQAISNFRF